MTLVYTTCLHVDYIINFKKFHRQVNKTGSTLGAASQCKRKKERSTNEMHVPTFFFSNDAHKRYVPMHTYIYIFSSLFESGIFFVHLHARFFI